MRALRTTITLVLIVPTLAAECNEIAPIPTPELPPSVSVDPPGLDLDVGEVGQLQAVVNDADDPSVTWSTSNALVATVDADGTVSAVRPGLATILATSVEAPHAVDLALVRVFEMFAQISPATLELEPGESATLTCTLRGVVTEAVITGQTVEWSSSAPDVAEVAGDGTVTAVSAGTAGISCAAQIGSESATATVTVGTPSGGCTAFGLSVASDPIQVVPGSGGSLNVSVDRVGTFAGRVEVALVAGAGGAEPPDLLSFLDFDPPAVVFQDDPNAPDTLDAVLYYQVRADVTVGAQYELVFVAGSPDLETDPAGCTLAVTFEVVP